MSAYRRALGSISYYVMSWPARLHSCTLDPTENHRRPLVPAGASWCALKPPVPTGFRLRPLKPGRVGWIQMTSAGLESAGGRVVTGALERLLGGVGPAGRG